MAELYFNAKGMTHSLRFLYREDLGVWESMVDSAEYFYFEADMDAEIWDLVSLAVSAYNGYRGETGTERLEWRSDGTAGRGVDRGDVGRVERRREAGGRGA